MAQEFTANGNTYNDSAYNADTNPRGFASAGHRRNLFPALQDILADATSGLSGVSSTALTVGTGAKVVTLAIEKEIADGAPILIVSADGTKLMYGTLTSRAAAVLTVAVTQVSGSGSASSWKVYVVPPQAPAAGRFTFAGTKTANYTLVEGEEIVADTAAGTFSIKVPTTASGGGALTQGVSKVRIVKTSKLYPLTIDRNGLAMNGQTTADALIPASKIGVLECTYYGGSVGWWLEWNASAV